MPRWLISRVRRTQTHIPPSKTSQIICLTLRGAHARDGTCLVAHHGPLIGYGLIRWLQETKKKKKNSQPECQGS